MKTNLMLATLFTLLVSGCTQDELVKSESSNGRQFVASFEQNESRTYVEDGNLLRWTAEDQISLFEGNALNQQYQFAGKTGANGGYFNKVNNTFGTGNDLGCHYAVYPYASDIEITESGLITATLPAEQSYAENSFGLGDNTMVAVTQDIDDTFLKFKNVGGYLKLQLYGDDVTIKTITLQGNANEKIAGTATITATYGGNPIVSMADDATETITLDCGEGVKIGTTAETATAFWIVVPPTTFESGFTITLTDIDEKELTQSTSNEIAVERNVIKPMEAFKAGVVTIPNNQIWYTSSDGNIVAPYETEVFGATIKSNVYENGKGIITFDGDVTTIGRSAFAECTSLLNITIPNSTISIGDFAFKNCESLESFMLPNSITSIGWYTFSGCSSLNSIIIPKNVSAIGEGAFAECESIESIIVEQSNLVYDSRNNCNAVVETISNTLIIGCKNTIISNTIETIGTAAFTGCISLENIIIPNSVTTIGMGAFAECSSLENIIISNNVTSIEGNAFYNCKSLTSITIPNNMTIIEPETFLGCISLTSITIPDNIHTIGRAVFYGCTSLSTVNVTPLTPPTIDNDTFINCNSGIKFYVPAESLDDYKEADYWKDLNLLTE